MATDQIYLKPRFCSYGYFKIALHNGTLYDFDRRCRSSLLLGLRPPELQNLGLRIVHELSIHKTSEIIEVPVRD
jgi:hypothetical protein